MRKPEESNPKQTTSTVERLKSIAIVSLLIAAIGMFINLKSLGESFEYIKSVYEAKFMATERKLDQLAAITTGGPLEGKTKSFGDPALVTDIADRGVRCHTFLDPLYVVNVYTNSATAEVIAFSVTTRQASFCPGVPLPMESDEFKGESPTLWSGSYASFDRAMGTTPVKTRQEVWASRLCYLDKYSFGRPGNFQTLCLYSVETGVDGGGRLLDAPGGSFMYTWVADETSIERKQLDLYRKVARPNSFLITAPGVLLEAITDETGLPLGPQMVDITAAELRARLK